MLARITVLVIVAVAFAALLAACPGANAHAQDKCGTNTQGVCAAEPIGTDPDAAVNVNPVVDPDVTDPSVVHAEADKVCVLPNSCPGA